MITYKKILKCNRTQIYLCVITLVLSSILFQPLLPQLYFVPTAAYAASLQDKPSTVIEQLAACSPANDDLGGTIFRDFNANGLQDTLEPGIFPVDSAGMSVYAYDDANTLVATAKVASDGTYSFPALLASNSDVRLELGNIPAYLQPGASGPNNSTSADSFDTATCNADFGLNRPTDFCQANPNIAVPCYAQGYQLDSNEHVLVQFPYSYADELDGNLNGSVDVSKSVLEGAYGSTPPSMPTHTADADQIGTAYGLAWDPYVEDLYIGAFAHRGVGYGPNGPGAIYLQDLSAGGSITPTLFADLNTIFPGNPAGIDVRPAAAPYGFVIGPIFFNSTNPFNFTAVVEDDMPLGDVTTTSLGDVELSADGSTLYVMNLYDRALYVLPTSGQIDSTTVARFPVPTTDLPILLNSATPSTCNPNDVRPFSIGTDLSSRLYVGAVCSAESSQDASHLQAYVWRFDGTNYDLVFTESLNYNRWGQTFNPWGNPSQGSNYPMPILADIEFDGENMILGIRDRFGDQQLYGVPDPNTGRIIAQFPRGYGDTLRACVDNSPAGAYEWAAESNGTCGTVTTAGANDGVGMNGGSYYYQDEAGDGNPPNGSLNGNQGALLQIPGFADIVTTAYDPVYQDDSGNRWYKNYNAGGIQRHSNSKGTHTGAYNVYDTTSSSSLRKQNGLGDIEALCRLAPVEIGNFVWLDLDGNGIQDPSENGIAGVEVALWSDPDSIPGNGDETQLMTTTTTADGEYYFDVEPEVNYFVAIDPNDLAVADYTATKSDYANDATHPESGNSTDLHDSDGIFNSTTGTIIIPLTAGNAGENNYTYDFGFRPADLGDLPDNYGTTIGNPTISPPAMHWIDGDLQLGALVDAESDGQPSVGASGDDINNNNTDGATDDEDGITFLTPLMPGEAVEIEVSAFIDDDAGTTATVGAWIDLDGDGIFGADEYFSTTLTASAGTNIVTDTISFTAPAFISDTVYSRFRIAFDPNEVAAPTGIANSGEVEDYVLMSLGDTVWLDNGVGSGVGNNGLLDGDEQGVPNVTVELYLDNDGTPGYSAGDTLVTTTETDANGNYLFTGLAPDTYIVHIPSDEFDSGGDLEATVSSDDAANNVGLDPDADTDDNDDNGIDPANVADYAIDGVSSAPVTLVPNNESTTDGNGSNSDLTVDFGFVQYDWGDLPDAYGTSDAASGPAHILDGSTFLGNQVDAELDGNPTDSALGDDQLSNDQQSGADDEDGIEFATPLMPGQTASITVSASTDGYLNAWFDFNGDGDFDDASERIVMTDTQVLTGTNVINFPVPVDVADTVYSRFRFTADPNEATTPNGPANSGEVEDYVLMSLGDTIWLDDGAGSAAGYNNGIQDGSEAGIPGVTVELYAAGDVPDVDSPVAVTQTAADGTYLFTGLVAGDYVVHLPGSEFDEGGELADLISSSDAANGVGQDPDTDADDGDDNGIDPSGPYATDGVSSAPITLAADSELTTDGNGTNSNLTVDFGLVPLMSIGNRVWHDANNNGRIDLEAGINGVMVELYADTDEDGLFDPAVDTIITSATTITGPFGNAGFYDFDGLTPGEYFVHIPTPPAAYPLSSTPTTSSDNGVNNDDNGLQSGGNGAPTTSPLITLSLENEPDATTDGNDTNGDWTVDFGFYGPVSVGDTVWYDDNYDGMQDTLPNGGTEDGVADMTVTLYTWSDPTNPITPTTNIVDVNGDPVIPLMTDANGNYLFDDLPPGTYWVEFSDLPQGYRATIVDAGSNDANDSDADPLTYSTPAKTITSGDEDLTLDMGIFTPVSVGNLVWYDNNQDGIQDLVANGGTEAGVPGVSVTLLDAATGLPAAVDFDGNPLTSTIATDNGGNYLFENLPPGDYYVQFDLSTLPTGYQVTDVNQGSDDAVDSDADPVTGIAASTGPLSNNQQDLSLDMGIWGPTQVGDTVWVDEDYDGEQDPDEPGVSGITVTLYDTATGLPIEAAPGVPLTTTTDANGLYSFPNLLPDDYFVIFDLAMLPSDSVVTKKDEAGVDDALDSDVDPTTGAAEPTGPLAPNQSDPTLDMGIVFPVAVGNFVWIDQNANGLQDAGEVGVSGVTATLYGYDENGDPTTDVVDLAGTPMTPQSTDESGIYLFENLPPGYYFVEFSDLPADYVVAIEDVNNNGDDAADSDVNATTLRTDPTPFLRGNNDPTQNQDLTLDLGIFRPVTVGNTVWADLNANGLLDIGEAGVENVQVSIFNADGTPATDIDGNLVGTTQTDVNGNYLFENLMPGDYYVEFDFSTLPDSDYRVTVQDAGSDDALDSDVDPSTGRSSTTSVLVGNDDPTQNQDLTLNMGIFLPVSVGNRVWVDLDRNGLQDAGEPGVEKITATLYDTATNLPVALDADGNVVAPIQTDADGNYLFETLVPGDYYVVFSDLPEGYVVTQENVNANGDDTLDSDVNPTTLATSSTGFLPGNNDPTQNQDLTLDMGILLPVVVGDRVWLDNNHDGIQDADEEGVPNITVMLFDADGTPAVDLSGTPVLPIQTDTDGNYLFENLMPGDYYVEFDLTTLPSSDYRITVRDAGADDTLDSDVDPLTGRSSNTGQLNGRADENENLTLDMGIFLPVTIGDFIWNDTNRDGIQDSNEDGVPNVTVTLYDTITGLPVLADADGVPIEPQQTDVDGAYLFENLVPGDYYLVFSDLPNNYIVTVPNAGADDALDSDVDPVTLAAPSTGFLTSGSNNNSLDFGIYQNSASVGDFIWFDTNRDGIQDVGESGVPGITVNLLDKKGELVESTLTDKNGHYLFNNLVPGDYIIEFDLISLPVGYGPTHQDQGGNDAADSDADTLTGRTQQITLMPGEFNDDLNMGVVDLLAELSSFYWFDDNGDGIRDVGESGVPNAEVILYNEDGSEVDRATTDENGRFIFNVPQGDYYIQYVRPDAFKFTQTASVLDGFRSGVNSDGILSTISLIPGINELNVGAGISQADPTAVALSNFSVVHSLTTDAEIHIEWRTTAEMNTAGFHIFVSDDGTFLNARQLTTSLIQSQGASGGLYSQRLPYELLIDPTRAALPIQSLSFWLFEVEADGTILHYGPATHLLTASQLDNSIFLPLIE